MTRVPWWFALAVLIAAVPAPGSAGDVTGTITLKAVPQDTTNRRAYPGQSRGHEDAATPPRNALEDVVVYLEGATAGNGHRPPPVLAQKGKSFVPQVLPIKVGTEVGFPNQDPFFHNVFSYSKITAFDLGRYPQGQSRTNRFDHVGLVKVFCEIHSQMRAYVLVLDTDAFCVADTGGRYTITGVPPGKYNLVAWHPTKKPKTVPVEIGDEPRVVDIDLE